MEPFPVPVAPAVVRDASEGEYTSDEDCVYSEDCEDCEEAEGEKRREDDKARVFDAEEAYDRPGGVVSWGALRSAMSTLRGSRASSIDLEVVQGKGGVGAVSMGAEWRGEEDTYLTSRSACSRISFNPPVSFL